MYLTHIYTHILRLPHTDTENPTATSKNHNNYTRRQHSSPYKLAYSAHYEVSIHPVLKIGGTIQIGLSDISMPNVYTPQTLTHTYLQTCKRMSGECRMPNNECQWKYGHVVQCAIILLLLLVSVVVFIAVVDTESDSDSGVGIS